MAITSSAKKANRASLRRRAFNARRKRSLHDSVKEVREAIAAGKGAEAAKLLPIAFTSIDKAAKRNVISKNAAANRKSKLARALARLSK